MENNSAVINRCLFLRIEGTPDVSAKKRFQLQISRQHARAGGFDSSYFRLIASAFFWNELASKSEFALNFRSEIAIVHP